MKITFKNSVSKYQVGGAMPAGDSMSQPTGEAQPPVDQGTPEQNSEQDPIMMMAQMASQAIQSQNCEMAMQVCQAFLEIVQQMQGEAPEEPQGEPVFKKGGTLVRRIKK